MLYKSQTNPPAKKKRAAKPRGSGQQFNMRLSKDLRDSLEFLVDELGMNRSKVVEYLINTKTAQLRDSLSVREKKAAQADGNDGANVNEESENANDSK